MAETMRPLLSKQAQKAYLGTLLFVLTAICMVFISAFAYAIFYYNFIPQVGLERIVHMQFECVQDPRLKLIFGCLAARRSIRG